MGGVDLSYTVLRDDNRRVVVVILDVVQYLANTPWHSEEPAGTRS